MKQPSVTSTILEVIADEEVINFARVVSLGSTISKNLEDVKPDDIIIVKRFSGSPITVDGQSLMLFPEEDVLAVLC